MNNLYEFGGTCDVVIRCKTARTIGGKTYQANEPYTILHDVYCNMQYKNIVSDGSAKNNIIYTRTGAPEIISFSGVTLTEKINDLIARRINSQLIGKTHTSMAQNGTLYLPETPVVDSIFVYHNNQSFTDFTVENDKLIGAFESDTEYLIFYDVQSEYSCFDFTTPQYGYFILDIVGKGNKDKTSNDIYIRIPAASLMSVPVFDLVNGDILYAPMQFKCIDQHHKPYFNVGG